MRSGKTWTQIRDQYQSKLRMIHRGTPRQGRGSFAIDRCTYRSVLRWRSRSRTAPVPYTSTTGGSSTSEPVASAYSKHTFGLLRTRSALAGLVSPHDTSSDRPSSPTYGVSG